MNLIEVIFNILYFDNFRNKSWQNHTNTIKSKKKSPVKTTGDFNSNTKYN